MFYPKLAAGRQQTLTTEAFGGYDHNLELAAKIGRAHV